MHYVAHSRVGREGISEPNVKIFPFPTFRLILEALRVIDSTLRFTLLPDQGNLISSSGNRAHNLSRLRLCQQGLL